MKIGDIRQMKDEELRAEADKLRRRIFDLRSQAVTEKLEDSSLVTKARRDVARILTVLRQRETAGAESDKK